MKLIVDSREQHPLTELFPKVVGVEIITQALPFADYTALHQEGLVEQLDAACFERKSLADLFGSFTKNYEREKAKWERAKLAGRTYILAIEGSISDVLRGHSYWKAGELHDATKDGLAQLRQLCTLQVKYGVRTMFFTSRKEMATYLLEYYLASGRWLTAQAKSP